MANQEVRRRGRRGRKAESNERREKCEDVERGHKGKNMRTNLRKRTQERRQRNIRKKLITIRDRMGRKQ